MQAQYGTMLPTSLQSFIHGYTALPEPSQRLLIRLLSRKGEYFRLKKMRYPEITDLPDAVESLCAVQFATKLLPQEPADWLGLFTKAEWLDKVNAGLIPGVPAMRAQSKRTEIDSLLLGALADLDSSQCAAIAAEPIVQVAVKPLFAWLKLLYFGNAQQDLSEFVLRDLALSRFESYPVSGATRLFSDWQQVCQHMALHLAKQQLANIDPGDSQALLALVEELPAMDTSDTRVARKNGLLRCAIARQLERNGQISDAVGLYSELALPPARERRARLLVQQALPKQAIALCKEIIAQPLDDDEKDFANNFAYRTARKLTLSYWPKPMQYEPPTEQWVLPFAKGEWGQRQPEWAVANQLNKTGVSYYVENCLFLAVFSLVYWPVYFASVSGAFSHPFQARPHDLYQPDFLAKRQAILEQVHSSINQQEYLPEAELIKLFQEKYGLNHRLIHWSHISEPLLLQAIKEIPTSHWRAIFNYLWGDLRQRRKGLPDLIYFPNEGGYELIEVKGPGDKLQVHQRRWLNFFNQHSISHKVINLVWQ